MPTSVPDSLLPTRLALTMQGAGKIVPFDEVDARLKHPESTGELAQGQGIIAGETAYFDSAIMTKGMAFAQYGLFNSSSLHLFICLSLCTPLF